MQIEGTPNERALLVTFAYVAGFTAAFILFGHTVTSQTTSTVVTMPPTDSQTAGVIDSAPAEEPEVDAEIAAEPATPTVGNDVVYENDGLYYYGDSQFPTLLTKEAATAGYAFSTNDSLEDKQGFHTAVPHYEYIGSQNHVFFCEQHDVTGECVPFVYDIDAERMYVFQDDDGHVALSTNEARQVTVTSAGSYVLGAYRSIDANEPWRVMSR